MANQHLIMSMIEALKVLSYVPESDCRYGICKNLKDIVHNEDCLFELKEAFISLGYDEEYPVGANTFIKYDSGLSEFEKEISYFSHSENLSLWKGKQYILRMLLIKELINHFEGMLNENNNITIKSI